MAIRPYLEVVQKHGSPASDRVPPSEVEMYRGKLPDGLLDFWATYGRGVWPNGRAQLCDPGLFRNVIDEIFAGDPDFPPNSLHVYAMDAFGNLQLIDGSMRSMSIDVNFRFFTVGAFADGPPDADLDFYIARSMLVMFGDVPEWTDDDGSDMFPAAVARLGNVSEGQMYGLFPALAAGGDNVVENFKKVSAPEYHSSVNQIDPLKYYDWGFDGSEGPRVIRLIGQQS
ncbi:GAD-like domain-containing protein [Agrobacterium sp. CG674]